MNILRAILGGVKEVDVTAYHKQFDHNPHVILDVRNPKEFRNEHIEGSVNIPFSKLGKKLDKLPKDQPIVCISRDGLRGREAAYMLQRQGFQAANLVGGIAQWRREDQPVSLN